MNKDNDKINKKGKYLVILSSNFKLTLLGPLKIYGDVFVAMSHFTHFSFFSFTVADTAQWQKHNIQKKNITVLPK